jgi:hypothetical protein
MKGLRNVAVEQSLYYDDKNSYVLGQEGPKFGYVSDLFKVNSYTFSFGFVRPLYDPRRASKARTKGVSRKISK